MNSETLTTNDRSEQIYEDDEDDGYYSKQERERFEIMEVPTGLLHTEEPIRWQKGGMIGAGSIYFLLLFCPTIIKEPSEKCT